MQVGPWVRTAFDYGRIGRGNPNGRLQRYWAVPNFEFTLYSVHTDGLAPVPLLALSGFDNGYGLPQPIGVMGEFVP